MSDETEINHPEVEIVTELLMLAQDTLFDFARIAMSQARAIENLSAPRKSWLNMLATVTPVLEHMFPGLWRPAPPMGPEERRVVADFEAARKRLAGNVVKARA
jgi:hypothetical protein